MSEFLTLAEMENQFDSEWVLIGNAETTDMLEITGGNVLHHSPSRDEVYRKALEIKPKNSAVIYTGSIPKGSAVIL